MADGSRRRAGLRAAARTPSLRDTVAFARAAHAGACVGGKPRWLRSLEVMRLLPEVMPGIRATHEDR